MPRSIWKGAISFGLVNIPVELHTAVRSESRISFRQLHKKDNAPIKYDRVCTKEEKSVPWDEIVKGYEYSKGKFVILDEEDFRAASVESSKTIEIQDFVKADEIDTRYFESPYYLLPQKGGEKAYALLREAIRKTGMIGLGNVTMRSNNMHFVGIRVVEDALVLEIMRYADELVDTSSFEFPSAENVRPAELTMAEQLVNTLAAEFQPENFSDQYKDNLMRIIEAKMKGQKIEVEEPSEPAPTDVIDLMARLQESLAQGKKKKGKSAATTRESSDEDETEAAPAKKKAAKSASGGKASGKKRKTA
ncbi:MAG TPA: Ku protein [Gemmatimonadaceae bacterium]|nr:Ku protein [Gemmatimonadaceae bacterium]